MPTDTEWTTLTTYLGGDGAGGKLKKTGTTYWVLPNENATNETGFTALPGGKRVNSGPFTSAGYYGYWWSSRVSSSSAGWYRSMTFLYGDVSRGWGDNKKLGYSVRCMMDN